MTIHPFSICHYYYFRLLFGFMSVTAFLSMWISNTATAAMMLPISHAVLQEICEQGAVDGNREKNENVTLVAKYVKNYNGTNEENAEVIESDDTTETADNNDDTTITEEDHSTRISKKDGVSHNNRNFSRLAKGLTLGIAYAANIGGTGTLIGTGPNLILSGVVTKFVFEVFIVIYFVFLSFQKQIVS